MSHHQLKNKGVYRFGLSTSRIRELRAQWWLRPYAVAKVSKFLKPLIIVGRVIHCRISREQENLL